MLRWTAPHALDLVDDDAPSHPPMVLPAVPDGGVLRPRRSVVIALAGIVAMIGASVVSGEPTERRSAVLRQAPRVVWPSPLGPMAPPKAKTVTRGQLREAAIAPRRTREKSERSPLRSVSRPAPSVAPPVPAPPPAQMSVPPPRLVPPAQVFVPSPRPAPPASRSSVDSQEFF